MSLPKRKDFCPEDQPKLDKVISYIEASLRALTQELEKLRKLGL